MPDQTIYQYGHMFKRKAYADEALATGVLKSLDALDILHKKAEADIAEIRNSRKLTKEGKLEALRKVAAGVIEQFETLDKVIAGYADQIGRLEQAIVPKRHPVDDLAWQLECREIRDHIKSLDPAEQEAFALSAMERGNQQMMEAILYAPIPFRFATQDMLDRIKEQRSAQQFPEETAQLSDLRLAERETASALKSVKAALAKHGVDLDRVDHSSAEAA